MAKTSILAHILVPLGCLVLPFFSVVYAAKRNPRLSDSDVASKGLICFLLWFLILFGGMVYAIYFCYIGDSNIFKDFDETPAELDGYDRKEKLPQQAA
ncbi:hypothetical protein DASC09_052000 [Saccharomycopsis crataegensis]|uniref:Uncharacterized protein n=1 Tax=Saccharomycopsis crataegensis TaxID=43959 RepID=A0AAV5QTE7_9ASCO|nr:hypothetical protein DASC09_052000 [Saccharomycopsis crataegensis]